MLSCFHLLFSVALSFSFAHEIKEASPDLPLDSHTMDTTSSNLGLLDQLGFYRWSADVKNAKNSCSPQHNFERNGDVLQFGSGPNQLQFSLNRAITIKEDPCTTTIRSKGANISSSAVRISSEKTVECPGKPAIVTNAQLKIAPISKGSKMIHISLNYDPHPAAGKAVTCKYTGRPILN